MIAQPFAWLTSGLLLSYFYQAALSFELQPIGSASVEAGRHTRRDDDFSTLDLLNSETFLWAGMNSELQIIFPKGLLTCLDILQDLKMADPR